MIKQLSKILFFVIIFLTTLSFAQDKEKVLQDLQKLYPYSSPQVIAQKIELTKNPSDLIKLFVPYYYFSLKENPALITELSTLKNEFGWCAGDAHLTNFGTLLNKYGKSNLVLNDYDDSGPCPLITDFLKLLVDLKFTFKDLPLVDIVRSYADGLAQNQHQFSKPAQKLLEKSEKKGPLADDDYLASSTKLKRNPLSVELSKQEVENLKLILTRTYTGKVVLLDAYAASKVGGGSHGLLRIITLVRFESLRGRLLQVLELKQQVLPGIFPLAVGPIPPTKQRLFKTLQLTQGSGFSPFYSVVRYSNLDMLIRPRWDGNLNIKAADYTPNELAELANDVAYQLGVLHSKTAPRSYLPTLATTTVDQWEKVLNSLAAYFIDVFKTLKSN